MVTDLNPGGAPFQGHMMVEADRRPQTQRTMEHAVCGDVAALANMNIPTRFREQPGLGRHKTVRAEVHGLQTGPLLLQLRLPGLGPGAVAGLETRVQPRHVSEPQFVLLTVKIAHYGLIKPGVRRRPATHF